MKRYLGGLRLFNDGSTDVIVTAINVQTDEATDSIIKPGKSFDGGNAAYDVQVCKSALEQLQGTLGAVPVISIPQHTMNWSKLTSFEQDFISKCIQTLVSKRHDYAAEGNKYSNFEGSAFFAGVSPYQSLMVMIGTKVMRIKELLTAGKAPKHESIFDTFMDAVNYFILLGGYWDQESKKPVKEMIFGAEGLNLKTNGSGNICNRCGGRGIVLGWIEHDGIGHPGSEMPCPACRCTYCNGQMIIKHAGYVQYEHNAGCTRQPESERVKDRKECS